MNIETELTEDDARAQTTLIIRADDSSISVTEYHKADRDLLHNIKAIIDQAPILRTAVVELHNQLANVRKAISESKALNGPEYNSLCHETLRIIQKHAWLAYDMKGENDG